MKQVLQLIRPFREMRKIVVLCLAMVMSLGAAWGQTTVTWPGTTALPGTATAVANDQNVTIMVSSTNTYSNPIRIYANNTVTIKALNNAKILSVAYEASSTGNYVTYAQNATVTPNVTPAVSGKIVTWTYTESADVTEFTFKPSSQTRSNGITITYIIPSATPTCATPTFSPAAGTYTQAQNVTISCTTEDVTIYYTTDGNAPTTNSTVYSAPINVSTNTTIKAMAAKSGYDNSAIATAEYAFITLEHAGTLADPYTVADAHTAIDANAGTQNVYVTGIVSDIPTEYNSTYGNITFNMVDEEGDEVFLQAYRCGGDEAANVAVGDVAVVYGNLIKYGSTYEFGSGCTLVSLTHPVVTTPTVTVTPATINAPAEGADGTLALTYENITDFTSFDYYFCDANGNALEGDNPNWIYAEINEEDDTYSLSYIINANDGAARTAYLKVYTFDDNLEEVFAIVTVNQEEFVAPTYAELPFEFNGGIADIESTDGLYQEGLGTDYSASNNPYTKLKFDGTGDWLLLQFSERPGTLTFNIKNNSFSGGTFKVQTSEDGDSYIDLETYTEISGTQNEEFTDLGENVRYIKWIYTNKVSGNVGLGNISLTNYVAPVPAITVASTTITAIAEQTTGTLGVTCTEIKTEAGVDVRWFESDGTTPASQPDWMIITDITFSNIDYLIYANDGVARTAYFKLYGLDVDLNDVYSELVTVTQAAAPQQYTLTVNASENVEIFTFVGETSEQGVEGSTTLQVTEGTTVGLSVSAASGYILESIVVDGVDVISQLDESGLYQFTMPTHNVAVTATAVEYVPFEPATYTLATSIESGQTYIIVGQYGGDYAMGTQNSNNRKAEEIIIDETTATVSTEDVYEFTISALEDESGFYSIYDGRTSGYLYAASSSANHLKTKDELDVNGKWKIIFNAETGAASIVATNSSNRNVMQYNSGSHLFSCYASASQYPVYLYVKEGTPVTETHTVYFYEGTGDCGTVSLTGSSITLPEATISCSDWAFAGWATAPVNETTTAPTLYTGTYAPTGDMFLYAIYQNNGTYNSFPACVYTQLDVTEGFESYTGSHIPRTFVKPTGWTVVTQNEPLTRSKMGRPQVGYGAWYAHEGDYCLFMDSLCVLAMPKLDNGISFSGLEMEFYLKQAFDYQYLEVGVMSDLADPESFELIETISNVGSAVNKRVVDFSGYQGTGRYIAFRNAYSGGDGLKNSYNYLDDIVVRLNNLTCGITELPYTQNFDNLTDITELRTGIQPECWTEAQRYANYAAAYEPQLVYGASYAHSGTYTLQLDGLCIYAMPELKVPDKSVEDMQLEFYVRQYSANCSLEVGVMSNLNDANSFVALETVSNNGVSGSQKHVVDFGQYSDDIPSGAKYIAFRNIYNSAWNRSPQNIDDINLTERAEDNCGITELPYTQNFDNLTDITELRTGIQPECWSEAHRYANYAAAYEPQLVYGASYAHSGTYTLQLDGLCIYAMPELKVPDKSVEDMQLEFYVRQYSANCLLEVGVMSNLNDANSFVALDTVSNNGVSGSQKHVVDFSQYAENIPSGAKYIAFRNIYNGAWNRSPQNLDDITLSVPEAKIAEMSSENEIDANGVERYLEDIRVYPNPTTGNLYIDAMDVQKVECYNQMGQLVGVYDNANELNISDLSNGVYMLRITVPQGVTMRKVVKK